MFITLFFFLFLLSTPSTRAESNPNLLNTTFAEFKVLLQELEDPETASYDAALAGAESENCEKAMAFARIKVPEISALNQKLTSFYRISRAFTEIIAKGSRLEDQTNE
ncbi:hypothetical protein Pint_07895 [Pistacia integerrima]|uniref:Uncharacterized protein n=1 Tax=Pistacia integerrima TaxID=434235 RepID=A0ACC0XUB3_9ROSI|nr:hypothetical protein Pint_07895 [Pistacia integerrima]